MLESASFSSTKSGGEGERPGNRGGERDDVSIFVIDGLRGGDTTGDWVPDSKEFKRGFDIVGAGLGFSYRGEDRADKGGNEEYGIEDGSGREAEE